MSDQIVDLVADAVGDSECRVALGGGADSAVLLWAATQAIGSERVRSVFVFHGLEGSSALRSAATAVSTAVGVECEVIERLVPDGGNLEARAREARYTAIEAMLNDEEIAMTAHSADDQAETALMRFLRGSGAGGIGGIPFRRGVWRRPFLGISREELRSRAEDLGLTFVDDPANTDERFMRVRMRHRVLPLLVETCGPEVKSLIVRSASLLAADDAHIEAEADAIPVIEIQGGISIPTAPLANATAPIASRVVRRGLRLLLDEHPGSGADVDAVLSVARGLPGVSISDGLHVVSEPPFVTIHREGGAEVSSSLAVKVGDTFMWSGSTYSVSEVEALPPYVSGGRFTTLRAAAFGGGFTIRGVEAGDRIDIEVGSTPVKELLRVAGIPVRLRHNSLLVTVGAKIAALEGVRVAPWARAHHGEPAVIIEREEGM